MVDWSLARQIARFASGKAATGRVGVDLTPLVDEAAAEVGTYTGLEAPQRLPEPELVDRGGWADANADTLAELLDPVGDRLSERFAAAGPLAGPLRVAAGATLAAEVGLVLGYMSQRVLGQYEISLLQPQSPPRLLFVGPNLVGAARELRVERAPFVRWVVLHEVTHVFQFSGVPWLREYLGALMREYMATLEVRIERGAAGGLPALPDPARIVETFKEGGLAALVQTREQRRILDRVQVAMSIVEGYSEHVMDVTGIRVLEQYEDLREAMDRRRRSRSAPERILQRLLGLDQKLRQYELGRSFCEAVVAAAGIDGLNRVWASPTALPSRPELERSERWLERVGAEPFAALPTA